MHHEGKIHVDDPIHNIDFQQIHCFVIVLLV